MSDTLEPPPGKNLFAYAGFDKLFLGSLTGKLADRLYQMAMVAAAVVVFAGGASENVLAQIQIVATVPLFFAYPLMGTLIDSMDRRRLMYGLMGVKGLLVLAFVPLLWAVKANASDAQLDIVRGYWPVGLGLVFLLSLVDSPFGPARAAAVPDVAPQEKRGLAASLMATSGLISLLLGSLIGGFLAQTRYLGSVNTILIAAGCYALAVVLLLALPAAVAIPGRLRKKVDGTEGGAGSNIAASGTPESFSFIGYMRGLSDGFAYAWKTHGIMDLVVFETVFWCVGSIFYLIFAWKLRFEMRLRPDDITQALALALGAAGVGLFLGAVAAGKFSRRVSPILTFPPAFILMGAGALLVFATAAPVQQVPGATAQFQNNDYVLIRSATYPVGREGRILMQGGQNPEPGTLNPEPEALRVRFSESEEPLLVPRAEITLLVTSFPYAVLLYAFTLGLGGGLLLGRVDADVLAIAEEDIRGRVFSIKATAFTLALLGTMYPLSLSGDPAKSALARWLGPGLLVGAIPALFMSWRVDIAIFAHRRDVEAATFLHRAGYMFYRALLKLSVKILFRYEVVGAEKIPRVGPVILAANHASFIDPILLGCCTRRQVKYIIYATYYRSFAHPLFRFLGAVPVDEATHLGALKAGIRALQHGVCLGIFPEGHVSADGRLDAAQGGFVFLAQRSGATVVPVALKGNFAALPRGAWLPRPVKVSVIVGEPFTVSKDISKQESAALTEKFTRDMAGMLGVEAPKGAKEQ